MHICLIMDNPNTIKHPVISVALQRLSMTHNVRMLDVRQLSAAEAIAQEKQQPLADLYLLKSHASQALDVAYVLEQQGAVVINSRDASLACQDRVLMAQRLHEAGLPGPQTWNFATLAQFLADRQLVSPLSLILKSRYSHRGDLVTIVHNSEQVQALAETWGQEPIIVQEFVAGDGWDIKLWVIDEQIFAARRRTPLEHSASKEDFPLAAHEIPTQWVDIALAIGHAFNLRLYGVDLLLTERGPMIVDVNAFPGFRGVPGADGALVRMVEGVQL